MTIMTMVMTIMMMMMMMIMMTMMLTLPHNLAPLAGGTSQTDS